ncbi:MAG: hypothetical protein JWL88_144 [Parcubacteria group bacterium]|nr:hypothetical protein [Parcubacteria group bacterium]
MRVPRILPSGKEVGIGLTICGDQMIFDDGESSHYWQIRAVEENVSLKIVQDFRNLGVRVIRQ